MYFSKRFLILVIALAAPIASHARVRVVTLDSRAAPKVTTAVAGPTGPDGFSNEVITAVAAAAAAPSVTTAPKVTDDAPIVYTASPSPQNDPPSFVNTIPPAPIIVDTSGVDNEEYVIPCVKCGRACC